MGNMRYMGNMKELGALGHAKNILAHESNTET